MEDCKITTIEKYEKRIPIARENFKRAGKEEQITLLEGDALEILKSLDETYDFIFYGCGERAVHLLYAESGSSVGTWRCAGVRQCAQEGDIIESRFAVERRNRTIHSRMREYLYELKHHKIIGNFHYPIGRWSST